MSNDPKADPTSRDARDAEELFKNRDDAARKAREPAVVTAGAQVLSIIAYANTDNGDQDSPQDGACVDEKQINIPQGWTYYSHSVYETTGLNGRHITNWVVRNPANPNRIIEVHVKVFAHHEFFHRCWVGAQLDVIIVPM